MRLDFLHAGGPAPERGRGQTRDHPQFPRAAELRDDSVGDQFADREMLRLAAASIEGDHGNCCLHRQFVLAPRREDRFASDVAHPVCAHRLVDMLEVARAQVLDVAVRSLGKLIANLRADNGLAWSAETHDPRREVDAMAIDVEFICEEVADVDPRA